MNKKEMKETLIEFSLGALALNAALQRGNVYRKTASRKRKEDFRKVLFKEVRDIARRYKRSVKASEHVRNIEELASKLEASHGNILRGEKLRIGTAQKALNLFLKYLWCQGKIPTPPHCPIDYRILRIAAPDTEIKWTAMKTRKKYADAIKVLKKAAKNTPLAKWELGKYGMGSLWIGPWPPNNSHHS
jgi:hypothetical protein